jgi:hypothetical protein
MDAETSFRSQPSSAGSDMIVSGLAQPRAAMARKPALPLDIAHTGALG